MKTQRGVLVGDLLVQGQNRVGVKVTAVGFPNNFSGESTGLVREVEIAYMYQVRTVASAEREKSTIIITENHIK